MICKRRHTANLRWMFCTHFMTNRQTLLLNPNEKDMLFYPVIILKFPRKMLSISLARCNLIFLQKQGFTWHPTHIDAFIFQYSIFAVRDLCSITLQASFSRAETEMTTIQLGKHARPEGHCSVDETQGMSNKADIVIIQGGRPMTSNNPQLLPSTQSTDHLEGESSGVWCAAYVGFLQAWQSIAIFLSDRVNDCTFNSISNNQYMMLHSLQ